MRAKDVLLKSLQDFTGTAVFVSHDRYFIDKLATRVFEVADGAVEVFPGNYEDYLWRKEGKAAQVAEPAAAEPKAQQNGDRQFAAASSDPASPARGGGRLNPIKLRQLKERRRAIEDEVTRLEVEIADYESALSNFTSVEETVRTNDLLNARRTDLVNLMTEWEDVAQTIEAN
jgi:ATP-binding cassette subfamily F protein 3